MEIPLEPTWGGKFITNVTVGRRCSAGLILTGRFCRWRKVARPRIAVLLWWLSTSWSGSAKVGARQSATIARDCYTLLGQVVGSCRTRAAC
ncbi:MAG: hypothetical protein ACXW6R_23540, partial [Candidatus Binatia bacterium]